MGHLVQGVTHENRNPIMTIGGFSQRLKKALSENSKWQDYINIILEESFRLEQLVEKVRELADVQTSTLRPDNIIPLIHEVMKKMQPMAESQNVKMSMHEGKDAYWIQMENNQMKKALSNLIENALESMRRGGQLTLTLEKEDDHLFVVLEDTGCGIPKAALPRIFDHFFTTKEEGKGTGLGLGTVKSIIEKHRGKISVKETSPKGTTFLIELPLFKVTKNMPI